MVKSIAAAAQGFGDPFHFGSTNLGGAAKVTAAFLGHAGRQVAGAGRAMHGFTIGRKTETFFRSFVSLKFRHN